jgi:dTDP-4-amino-4,6-dideoxygalactose transaminase
MHYGGYLMEFPAWRSFSETHRLLLIEDAAHAPAVGEVGSWCDASIFSFFTNKNMTTAEGGMIIMRNAVALDCVRNLRSHGMTTSSLDRHRGHAYSYDIVALGYNYRMDELRAALGLTQLPHLLQWNARRRKLTDHYRQRLAEQLPAITAPFDSSYETAAHLMPILLPEGVQRSHVMDHLRQNGIQSSIHYPPVHGFSYYRERFPGVSLPNTEAYCSRVLTLPLHQALHEYDVDRVVNTLKEAVL